MRPLDYSDQQPDGLYARCMCGLPFTAHPLSEVVDPETREVLNPNRCKRYRPMIGKHGRTENKPIKTYSEVFGDALDRQAEGFKESHTHTIARRVLNRIAAHGAREFPRECCGFILGDKLEDVRPITNTNRYGNGSYTMDPMQQIAVLREVENVANARVDGHAGPRERSDGKELKVVYHSHPNMAAFFSAIDRDAATSIDPKKPDWPETVWIVMSIRSPGRYGVKHKLPPQLADARAYLWNPAITDFSEITLKVVE